MAGNSVTRCTVATNHGLIGWEPMMRAPATEPRPLASPAHAHQSLAAWLRRLTFANTRPPITAIGTANSRTWRYGPKLS